MRREGAWLLGGRKGPDGRSERAGCGGDVGLKAMDP